MRHVLYRCATTTVKTSEVGKLGLPECTWPLVLYITQQSLGQTSGTYIREHAGWPKPVRAVPACTCTSRSRTASRWGWTTSTSSSPPRCAPAASSASVGAGKQGSCFEARNKVKMIGDAYLLLTQQPDVQLPVFPKFFSKEILLMLLWFINGTG